MDSRFDLTERVALIAGASRGIGENGAPSYNPGENLRAEDVETAL